MAGKKTINTIESVRHLYYVHMCTAITTPTNNHAHLITIDREVTRGNRDMERGSYKDGRV